MSLAELWNQVASLKQDLEDTERRLRDLSKRITKGQTIKRARKRRSSASCARVAMVHKLDFANFSTGPSCNVFLPTDDIIGNPDIAAEEEELLDRILRLKY